MGQRWLFLDVETTGSTATRDRVTEVAWVLLDGETGQVTKESHLVNPDARIPAFIQQLTGITDDMVADAPRFSAIAPRLAAAMDGAVFVAHNARFDYGFIKNEFKRIGQSVRAPVLCSVKLSRLFFPAEKRHNLDAVMARHQLQADSRHRALTDADLIYQFWLDLQQRFGPQKVLDAAKSLISQSSWPSHLDADALDEMPDTPGVYIFYGEKRFTLYVGKSKHLRQRVLSHFSGDHAHGKELSLSMQVRQIEWHETPGEIGALLLEASLVKQLAPSHNVRLRRNKSLCAWRFSTETNAPPSLVWTQDLDAGAQDDLYGLFTSQRHAQTWLTTLAETHQLCKGRLGLEKVKPKQPCFGRQLRQCKGVCVGEEAPNLHDLRLLAAMVDRKVATWPFAGPVGFVERSKDKTQTAIHVVDRWCYLGTATQEGECADLLETARPQFDPDIYKILRKAAKELQAVPLQRG
ncbi:MAG: exonuclease domain-containing protein [Burkholderiaceae bacterium]|jgi:DNA polymerase III subunit epsilon|nr:exonuclease domain-containing protein [Burkholderiaceae bacterium]